MEAAHSRGRLDAPQRQDHWPGGWRAHLGRRRAFPALPTVEFCPNGRVCVRCATQDIGTGTYTLFAQVVHAKTGVPLDRIDVFLGDTSLPDGPTSGGSMVTSAILPAASAVNQAVSRLLHIADAHAELALPWHAARFPRRGRWPGDPKAATASRRRRTEVRRRLAANSLPFEDVLKLANLSGIIGHGRTFPSFEDPKARSIRCIRTARTLQKLSGNRRLHGFA